MWHIFREVLMEDLKLENEDLDSTDQQGEDFSLYTEKIVVNPLVKYKKLLAFVRGFMVTAVVLILACIGVIFAHKYIQGKENSEVAARNPLVLGKDEYSIYSKSPALDAEEPDIAGIYYWIQYIMQTISESLLQIGDNTAGVVAGEVDGDYIILTEYNQDWSSEDYYVKVDEETLVGTELVSTDEYTGLALIAVNRETLNNAGVSPRIIKMGNSYEALQNEIVIAMGRVQDNSEGYATGYITEVTSDSGIDMSLDILKTNVELKVGDYAFIFDINGYLLGIADSESGDTDDEAEHIIGISSLKPLIEKMSTAVPVAYLGIKCTNITKDIAEKFHFPEGIYVTEVELDSPAYKAGIQAGDIIYGIGDEEVMAVQTLSEKILTLNKDDTIKVKIKRTGKGGEYREIEYSAKLAER
jgi:S1-C subfamily serine protease